MIKTEMRILIIKKTDNNNNKAFHPTTHFSDIPKIAAYDQNCIIIIIIIIIKIKIIIIIHGMLF